MNNAVRPLGMLEKLFSARQALGIHGTVMVTVAITAPLHVNEDLIPILIARCFPALIERHPALCYYVDGIGSSKPVYHCLRSIDRQQILQVTEIEGAEQLPSEMQKIHDSQYFIGAKPLWKVVLIKCSSKNLEQNPRQVWITFVYDHVIGDGLSGAALVRTLLKELARAEKLPDCPDRLQVPEVPSGVVFAEPIEKLIRLPISWSFLLQEAAQEYAPRWLAPAKALPWAGPPVQCLEECKLHTRIRLVTIPRDDAARLIEQARQFQTTLTSLINAVITWTLAEAVPEAELFVSNTPYSLRRVTGTPRTEMVNQSSTTLIDCPSTVLEAFRRAKTIPEQLDQLWKTCQHFHKYLQADLAKCPQDDRVGLCAYVTNHVEHYRKKLGQPRESTWELSNLGAVETPQLFVTRGWMLDQMIFTQSAQPLGTTFSVNGAGVQNGTVAFSITWQESIFDESIADVLAKRIAELPELLRTSPSE